MDPSRRRFLALMPVAALVGACGFEPLLARRQDTPSIQAMLAAIQVSRIGDGRDRRLGQIMRNELIDRFSTGSGLQPPRFVLDITLTRNFTPLIIESSNTVTRSNLVMTAAFTLSDLESGEVLYQSTARSTGSHDVVVSEYSSQVARQDTARKAARDLANTITYLLSFHFDREHDTAGS